MRTGTKISRRPLNTMVAAALVLSLVPSSHPPPAPLATRAAPTSARAEQVDPTADSLGQCQSRLIRTRTLAGEHCRRSLPELKCCRPIQARTPPIRARPRRIVILHTRSSPAQAHPPPQGRLQISSAHSPFVTSSSGRRFCVLEFYSSRVDATATAMAYPPLMLWNASEIPATRSDQRRLAQKARSTLVPRLLIVTRSC
ncbi:hypothetical protein GQ55_3G310400 [Panicum hallii var. hallii]|uniref:Bifunctional inhibitor/plant lipid transfer protein/seed storage helical domain-containing protein n=1 Tax=Panicum hallii var. hallii TaxID=1504633 RepID=A0A2T7EF59_9POAL|nr:hypothetical protein GQ55_3G310400 [Panicum hallii var. hallii]